MTTDRFYGQQGLLGKLLILTLVTTSPIGNTYYIKGKEIQFTQNICCTYFSSKNNYPWKIAYLQQISVLSIAWLLQELHTLVYSKTDSFGICYTLILNK